MMYLNHMHRYHMCMHRDQLYSNHNRQYHMLYVNMYLNHMHRYQL